MALKRCPGLYKAISFKVPQSFVKDAAAFSGRGYLRGRVVNGKVVIENWTARDVYQPQNVCWWEKVKKAKGSRARRRPSARRTK